MLLFLLNYNKFPAIIFPLFHFNDAVCFSVFSFCLREVKSAMINSLCNDEVSGPSPPYLECFRSLGERLVNDCVQSVGRTWDACSFSAQGSICYSSLFFWTLSKPDIEETSKEPVHLSLLCVCSFLLGIKLQDLLVFVSLPGFSIYKTRIVNLIYKTCLYWS